MRNEWKKNGVHLAWGKDRYPVNVAGGGQSPNAKAKIVEPVFLPDDVQFFCDVADKFITAANGSYAAVFCGRPNRIGAGMSAQAGMINEERI